MWNLNSTKFSRPILRPKRDKREDKREDREGFK